MKSATTTEITRHMITAMTMPTYRATSSVLGATGEEEKRGGGLEKTEKMSLRTWEASTKTTYRNR